MNQIQKQKITKRKENRINNIFNQKQSIKYRIKL